MYKNKTFQEHVLSRVMILRSKKNLSRFAGATALATTIIAIKDGIVHDPIVTTLALLFSLTIFCRSLFRGRKKYSDNGGLKIDGDKNKKLLVKQRIVSVLLFVSWLATIGVGIFFLPSEEDRLAKMLFNAGVVYIPNSDYCSINDNYVVDINILRKIEKLGVTKVKVPWSDYDVYVSELIRILNESILLEIDNRSVRSLVFVNSFKMLRHLKLHECNALMSVASLSDDLGLETLVISNCNNIQNLQGMPDLSILKVLSIKNCDSIRSLEGLPCLQTLETLEISDCDSLLSLKHVPELPLLKRLILKNCKHIDTLKYFPALPLLEDLDFTSDLITAFDLNNEYDYSDYETYTYDLFEGKKIFFYDLGRQMSLKSVKVDFKNVSPSSDLWSMDLSYLAYCPNVDTLVVKNLNRIEDLIENNIADLSRQLKVLEITSQSMHRFSSDDILKLKVVLPNTNIINDGIAWEYLYNQN